MQVPGTEHAFLESILFVLFALVDLMSFPVHAVSSVSNVAFEHVFAEGLIY